jgi:hypothetical protein
LELKAKLESSSSHFTFKRLAPGPFNMGFIWSTCTGLPHGVTDLLDLLARLPHVAPQLEKKKKNESGSSHCGFKR